MFLQIGPPESPKQESMPPRNQLDEVFFGEDFFGLYQYLVGSVYFDNLLFLAASLSVVKKIFHSLHREHNFNPNLA